MFAKYGILLLKIEIDFPNMVAMRRTTISKLIHQGTGILVWLVQYIFGGNCNFMHMSVTSRMLISSPWNHLS